MSKLKQHASSVYEEKRYLCDLCKNIFTHNSNLKRHIKKVHEGLKQKYKKNQKIKSFRCEICGGCFPDGLKLTKHVSSVHEMKTPFEWALTMTKKSDNNFVFKT